VNLPPIGRSLTSSELRERALAALNGESVQLSKADRERRERVLAERDVAAEAGLAVLCALLRRREPGFDFRPTRPAAGGPDDGGSLAPPSDLDPVGERDAPVEAA
jgi:hypothetical protein